jgi:hypothetical protein
MNTIGQIYNSIIAAKESCASLFGLQPNVNESITNLENDLNSNSKVAEWRLWAYIYANVQYAFEYLFEKFMQEVDAKIETNRYGTLPWYVTESKRFQLGDTYQVINYKPTYPVIDPTHQIVKQASANDSMGFVFLKLAKDVGGSLEPLDGTELAQFQAFINDAKPAGVYVNCISLNADILKTNISVYYSPLIAPNVVTANVKAAINNYVQTLPFDGKFRTIHLVDAIQNVTGVVDVVINSLNAVQGATTVAIANDLLTASGYMEFDANTSIISLIASS